MNNEFLKMQKLAGLITESEYKAKLEEEDVMGRIGKSYPAPGTKTSSEPERELSDIWKEWDLLNNNFEFIDLSIPNIKIGDNVGGWRGSFGKLVKIKDDNYYVQFDVDYSGERPTKYKKESFEESFLVEKN